MGNWDVIHFVMLGRPILSEDPDFIFVTCLETAAPFSKMKIFALLCKQTLLLGGRYSGSTKIASGQQSAPKPEKTRGDMTFVYM